ncbi:MAG: TonB family protein [Deltaproteobacteria bacterium]|nr:TonB family protein [Deltaproteobacteria bacterium]
MIGAGGLKSAVAASLIAHTIIAIAAIALYGAPQKKLFVAPNYTVVSIASPSTPFNSTLLTGESKPALPGAPNVPSVIGIPSASPEKPVKTTKIAKETERPIKTDVGAAIKKIERKAQKEKALERDKRDVETAIESIKKKQVGKSVKGAPHIPPDKGGLKGVATTVPVPMTADQKAQAGTTGASLTQENLSAGYPAYYALIRDRVQENWKYPFQDDKALITISMKIGRTGALLDVALEKGSGNALLDSSLINAVKKAAPFPPLPHGFEGDFLETGIRFCQGCAE